MSPPELEDPGQGVVPCASEYPIMEWEDAEHRLVLPQSLRTAIEVDDPILRWSRRKRALVLADHAFDEPIIRDINRYLEHWSYCGRERGTDDVWRVLFEVDARWYSLTLGGTRPAA